MFRKITRYTFLSVLLLAHPSGALLSAEDPLTGMVYDEDAILVKSTYTAVAMSHDPETQIKMLSYLKEQAKRYPQFQKSLKHFMKNVLPKLLSDPDFRHRYIREMDRLPEVKERAINILNQVKNDSDKFIKQNDIDNYIPLD